MLKIDRTNRTFTSLPSPSFREAGVLERQDLQACIINSSAAFFAELGLDLFLIGQEVCPSDDVDDRIDVLCVDREGAAVVVELKRGENKLQMLQAISYAGMVARWSPDRFEELITPDAWEQLVEFLEVDTAELNRVQRIVLVAEGFDYALLSGADWLTEQHGVDLRCCSVSLAVDQDTETEYLACASVYPPPALTDQATARGRRSNRTRPSRWKDWEAALEAIQNEAIRDYVARELSSGRENGLRRRTLHYLWQNKRRWKLHCRSDRAYVWQKGRFDGDESFWAERLGADASVEPKKGGAALRFYLRDQGDLDAFHAAVVTRPQAMAWRANGEQDADEGE